MRLRTFPTRKPYPTNPTPQDWKLDPEITVKLDDLCVSERVCDYEKSIFDNNQDELRVPNPREMMIESDHTSSETCSTPRTALKSSLKFSPEQKDYVRERIWITT